jgi:hypothetical protein
VSKSDWLHEGQKKSRVARLNGTSVIVGQGILRALSLTGVVDLRIEDGKSLTTTQWPE